MKMKNLNLKNMKETLVNYSACQSEFDKIWHSFLKIHGESFTTNVKAGMWMRKNRKSEIPNAKTSSFGNTTQRQSTAHKAEWREESR